MAKSDSLPEVNEIRDSMPAATLLPKVIQFKEIARCGNEVWIQHEGKLYRLQSTKQGKLVLTK